MKRGLLPVLGLLLVLPLAASADTLNVVAGDNARHVFPTPDMSGNGFFNNRSYDGAGDCSIGYWLKGVGGCTAASGQFYANTPRVTPDFVGGPNTRFEFQQDGNTPSVTVTTKLQVTSWALTDVFGWFPTANPQDAHPLFGGTMNSLGRQTFVPSGNYGFYLTSNDGTYYSNASPETRSHFVVFDMGNGRYIFGAEDMWFNGDWDYNDLVYEVQLNNVPEPASLLLLGAGLLGVGGAARRRRRLAR